MPHQVPELAAEAKEDALTSGREQFLVVTGFGQTASRL